MTGKFFLYKILGLWYNGFMDRSMLIFEVLLDEQG